MISDITKSITPAIEQYLKDLKTKVCMSLPELTDAEKEDLTVAIGGATHDLVVNIFNISCTCNRCFESCEV